MQIRTARLLTTQVNKDDDTMIDMLIEGEYYTGEICQRWLWFKKGTEPTEMEIEVNIPAYGMYYW